MALKFAVNNSLSAVTILPTAIPTGALTLIQTQTASSSATIDFTSGIDSTYDSYVFKFYDIHPSSDGAWFEFNMSTDGGSNYNVTKTSSSFNAFHYESDSSSGLAYRTDFDLAQSTSFQTIAPYLGNGNDESASGFLQIFNPSSTTFVKHFIARSSSQGDTDYSRDGYYSGYGNTTSAIDGIQFSMSSGNIDSGTIKMYGVK